MITITNIRNAVPGTETWAIVRSMTNPSNWIKQVPALSPSRKLFFAYRNMVRDGIWGYEKFQNFYVPEFLKQIKNDPEAINLLNQIYRTDKAGGNLVLCCYCKNEEECHRSIIAGLLQGVGCSVETDTGADYTKYYRDFLAL